MPSSVSRICFPAMLGLACLLSFGANETWAAETEEIAISMSFVEIPASKTTFGHRVVFLDSENPSTVSFPTTSGALMIRRNGDRFQVDRNGDGAFDILDGSLVSRNETFHVLARVAGQPVNYPMRIVQVYPRAVFLESRGALIGHGDQWLALVLDHNLDGRFGQVSVDRFKLTRFSLENMQKLATSGDAPFWTTGVVPLGKVVNGEDTLYDLDVLDDGRTLSLRSRAGTAASLIVETDPLQEKGEATVEAVIQKSGGGDEPVIVFRTLGNETPRLTGYSMLLSHHDGIHYQQISGDDSVTLAPGKYHLSDLSLTFDVPSHKRSVWPHKRGGDRRATALLWGRALEPPLTIQLDPGVNRLSVGPPFELKCRAVIWGSAADQFLVEDAYLEGRSGETYRFQFSGEIHSELKHYFHSENQEIYLGKLEPTQLGFQNSWRRIPANVASDPDAELVLEFNAAGMEPIEMRKKLSELRQNHPPGSVLLQQLNTALRQRRFDDAVRICLEAGEWYPRDARVQNDSAWVLITMDSAEHHRPDKALEFSLRAVELTDYRNGLMLDTYALALFKTGDLENAVKYQLKALELEPANWEIQKRLDDFQEALKAPAGSCDS